MAMIPQKQLFGWEESENLGDLQRLELVLRSLPDEALIADKGLDDMQLIELLWDGCGIRPVIDIRNLWKDGEETKRADGHRNMVYDYQGSVYCYSPMTGERRPTAYGGVEQVDSVWEFEQKMLATQMARGELELRIMN